MPFSPASATLPRLLRARLPGLRMALLSLLLGLVVLGRALSPVGGSLMAAADGGPVFLTAELCAGMTDSGDRMAANPLSSAHDCCWWMSGAAAAALVLVALTAVLLLLPDLRRAEAVRWSVRITAPPRLLWRFACASRAPPPGCQPCFSA